ncbi:VOC family protein [Parahaliea sp. F7430]|uniref:VOC family protein n=1 Tax=Sediminihaliea albiluteola TaxID=2758564 RepID=A0A7W2YIE3_9GAMM|nr:VOC family protein [Sediminihaliea albiluteola]MBA6411952.1 VOC family protein [Sediminihaliea albiluteola]
MALASIGYLRIGSTDVDAWMSFGTDVLGLMDAEQSDLEGVRYLRMDRHPFRFAIEPCAEDKLLSCGLEYRNAADWQAACDALRKAGHTLTAGDATEAARLCVSDFVTVSDPAGNVLELYYGRRLDYKPLISPTGVSAFVTGDEYTGDMGFGHAVIPAPDIEASIAFYTELIGLGISDDLYPPMPEGAPESRVVFMHADNPRQHSLALYNQPTPSGVVHMMVEVSTLDEVGRGLDLAKAAGHPVIASLGRHVNDNMCSFYVLAPGGIAVEYGYDGLLVDWETYTPTVSTEGDLWGHEYNFPG